MKEWLVNLDTALEAAQAIRSRMEKHENPIIQEMIEYVQEIEASGKLANLRILKGKIIIEPGPDWLDDERKN